jgi:hypothetical protein
VAEHLLLLSLELLIRENALLAEVIELRQLGDQFIGGQVRRPG